MEGGKLWATGVPSPAHQVVNSHHHWPRDEELVEDDVLQRVVQLLWIHLDNTAGASQHFTHTSYRLVDYTVHLYLTLFILNFRNLFMSGLLSDRALKSLVTTVVVIGFNLQKVCQ